MTDIHVYDVGQPFEQGQDDVEIVERDDDVRVEVARLGAVAEVQHLFTDAGFGRRFAARPGRNLQAKGATYQPPPYWFM